MDKANSITTEEEVKYEKASYYGESYITGMWGGINQEKKIQIAFYEDILDIPEKSIMKLAETAEKSVMEIVEEIREPKNARRIRSVKHTITFDFDKLESFITFLEGRREQYKTLFMNDGN